jgi:hypothetical protein
MSVYQHQHSKVVTKHAYDQSLAGDLHVPREQQLERQI